MDFRVKSNGKIQAVAEDGTPLGGEFTFHYTFFRAYGEDGNTLLSKLPSKGDKKKNQLRLENVRRLMARAMEHHRVDWALVPSREAVDLRAGPGGA